MSACGLQSRGAHCAGNRRHQRNRARDRARLSGRRRARGGPSRETNKIDTSVARLKQKDTRSAGYAIDASNVSDDASVRQQVWTEQGPIDILLNAQGTTVIKPALDFSEDEYALVMRTNIDGVFWACTEFGRRMVERKSGSIINIGSLSSFRGWPGSSVYAMTKAAVVSLTQSLAAEWANSGVASTRSRRASS